MIEGPCNMLDGSMIRFGIIKLKCNSIELPWNKNYKIYKSWLVSYIYISLK